MRAFAAQIIPSEHGLPGAEEAGSVYFIDRAMGIQPYAERLPELRRGIADLDVRARRRRPAAGFADLQPAEQIAVMREVENTPFFASARMLTIMGTLADSSYGGNMNGAGWHLVGMQHASSFQSPFGWYDTPAQRGAPLRLS